jgi:hypothetical protein
MHMQFIQQNFTIQQPFFRVGRLLLGRPLQPFVPQMTFLSLITTGRQHAIASKGWLCFEARYCIINSVVWHADLLSML